MDRKTVLLISLTLIITYICIDATGNGRVVVPDDGDMEAINLKREWKLKNEKDNYYISVSCNFFFNFCRSI